LLQYVPEPMMVRQVYREYARRHGIRRDEEKGETWQLAIERSVREGAVSADDFKRLNEQDARIMTGYMQGLGKPGKPVDFLAGVPWSAWRVTLFFWFSVLSLVTIGGICAVVIVHRQWAEREHLAYPIVTFANELIGHDDKGLFNQIFRTRAFWLGFALSFGILFVRGYQKWFPGFVTIPIGINFGSLRELEFVKQLMKVPEAPRLLNVEIYFAAVGLAYFLSSEASFSLGISGWLFVLVAAPLVVAGVNMSGTMIGGGLPANMY
ncbi:unnamed protein product, partial [marine sediment metagenome]